MSLVTIKVSLNDEKYINWKNAKYDKQSKNQGTFQAEHVEQAEQNSITAGTGGTGSTKVNNRSSKIPNVKINDDTSICDMKKLFKPETMSDGMLQLYQPFGCAKILNVIDQMYCDKYNNITKKKCGWCTLSFTHYPAVIPYNIQKKNTRIQRINNAPLKPILNDDAFVCKGCFCSFNCAMAEICHGSDIDKTRQKELLYTLYRLSGYNLEDEITPSPPKELMIDYGGILSEDEYIALIGSKNKFELTYPHIICIGARIARVKIYSS
jgi:hypothetical protein